MILKEAGNPISRRQDEMRQLSQDSKTTIRKVKELAAFREEYIMTKGKPPLFKPAIEKIGISPDTVKRHAPELFLKWFDVDFHSDLPK